MEKSSPFDFGGLLNLRVQFGIGIIIFFVLSMIMGIIGFSESIIYTVLWALFGFFTLFCISKVFPDTWNYVFWLVGIYFFAALGLLFMLDIEMFAGIGFFALGIFIEVGAILGIGALLVQNVKNIRDDISGISERSEHVSERLKKEGKYVPLGFWALAVVLFWLFANLSIYGWYLWASSSVEDINNLTLYIFSEIMVLILGFYILWVPQYKFEWRAEPIILTQEQPEELRLFETLPDIFAKTREKLEQRLPHPEKCPICGSKVVSESRSCSSCGTTREFDWCTVSEEYIVTCPHCKSPTSFGRERCVACGKRIDQYIKCKCGAMNTIDNWRIV